MPVDLDKIASEISKRPPCLLLGAGASVPSGAPTAAELARDLSERFSSPERELADLAEILEIRRGRRPVFEAIRERLEGLSPSGGMGIIPHIPWRAIYTTNWDQLVEKAFASAQRPCAVVRSNYDFPLLEEPGPTPLFKIHGCISQDRCLGHNASMVLTRSDYRAFSKFRDRLFERMGSDLFATSLLIVGQRLADPHLQEIVVRASEQQRELGLSNRIFIVAFDRDEDAALIFERDNIAVAFGGIDELMDKLAGQALPPPSTTLAIVHDRFQLPPGLRSCTVSVDDAVKLAPRPKSLFGGRSATYADIHADLTIRRDLEFDLLTRLKASALSTVITGVGGVGKSTLARRVLYQLHTNGMPCWEHRPEFPLRRELWLNVEAELRRRGSFATLLLDDVTRYQREANEIVEAVAMNEKPALQFIATAESSKWFARVKSPLFFRDGEPLRVDRLSDKEIRDLVDLLERSQDLSNLVAEGFRRQSRDRRVAHLRSRCASDMFVCLKYIFGFETLDNILLEEFAELPANLKEIYKYVAVLEAAGVRPHRQLIIRLLGLEANELATILGQLDGLVDELDVSIDEGIYLWATRHLVVAQTLAKYKMADPAEFTRFIERVVGLSNPSIEVERLSLVELCNAEFGIQRIADPETRISLFETLIAGNPRERVPWHRLIAEYLKQGNLAAADVTLQEAERTVRLDPPLHRYRVRILVERAQNPRLLDEDRRAILSGALEEARAGIRTFQNSFYSYLVFDDVAREWHDLTGDFEPLKESVENLRSAYEVLLEPRLSSQLRRTEAFVARRMSES